MANDLNQCNFIGRLGRDPEIRYMPSGDAIASFSIAVGWKGKDKEGTEWVNMTAFGKLAEIIGQYLKKGSKVFVSGRFKTDKYEKDGVTHYNSKIVVDQMQMLDGKPQDGDSANDNGAPPQRQAASGGSGRPQPRPAPNFSDMDDDIPF
jgi:single-strand DNA-binding protein